MSGGPSRAGRTVEDLCRACRMVRTHTVIAADAEGNALRVLCDHCGSQHNWRGGERSAAASAASEARPAPSERGPAGDDSELEAALRRVIREELGFAPVAVAAKWRGGELVLRPGREGLQEKAWPIEGFFQKIVMLRNRLRVLEQQVNAAELPTELKLKLQGYVTACYGSLTSFNVLFAEDADRFRGGGGRG